SENSAGVDLDIVLKNEAADRDQIKVVSSIVDADSQTVETKEQLLKLEGQKDVNVKMNFRVESPKLWSPEHPNMYSIQTKIYDGSTLLDTYESPLGIRKFRFDAKEGFFLNGEHMKLYGVCLHHDLGALGAAININAIE